MDNSMIVPVRCFTCGKVLADKWEAYVRRCKAESTEGADGPTVDASGVPPTPGGSLGERPGADGKTARGRILDDLGITNCCCRVVMTTHVDLSLVI